MRIQILPLPAVMAGDDLEEPFALVVDQWEGSPAENADLKEFGLSCGARAVMTTPFTAEVVDRYAEPEPPKTDFRMQFSVPEDFDPEKVKRELRFAFGLCRDCGKRSCVCPPALEQRLQDAGEKARQALGIDGTMGDAQDVPHPYNDDEGAAPYCIVCGLADSAQVHKRRDEVDAYEALRRDVREYWEKVEGHLRLLGEGEEDRLRRRVSAESGSQVSAQGDAQRGEIDRLRAIVSRVVEIPREPETLPYIGAEEYLRGWQSVRALIDKALLPEEAG